MNSIETKEMSPALANTAKAKARRAEQNVVVQPVATMTENKNAPTLATPPQAPEPPATPPQAPIVDNDPRNSEVYRSLKAHHDKTIHEERQRAKLLEEQLAAAQAPKLDLPKTKEEMEAYRKQYPEAMDVFKTLAIETVQSQSAELREQLKQVRQYQAELEGKEAFNRLLTIHPDAMEIKASPKFLDWFNEQPKAIQQILESSPDVNAVAKQLTLYKLEVLGINPKEAKKAEAKSNVDSSLGVPVKGTTEITSQKKIWSQTEINEIASNYKRWLPLREEIDAAYRENRVDRTK